MTNPAINRVLKSLPPELLSALKTISPADLNSLLLEVFREQTKKKSPPDVLNAYKRNRFVQPSAIDPVVFAEEEIRLLRKARHHGFEVLELSPVAPLGSCSYGFTDQNKIISALRGTEVVADATNVMALESATRRKTEKHSIINLCTAHRHIRAQSLHDKRFTAHFKVFCAVSQGRDLGNFDVQCQMAGRHVRLYAEYFSEMQMKYETVITFKMLDLDGGSAEVFGNKLKREMSNVRCHVDFMQAKASQHYYYKSLRISIDLKYKDAQVNIGDGGFVNWGSKLCSDQKEVMFTSAIGTELLWKVLREQV